MPLSLNEMRERAITFAHEYADIKSEKAEAQSFYNDFFDIFGIERRRVASFEEPIKKSGHNKGSIDLLWKGVLLVEHKSSGNDLDKALKQAYSYLSYLKKEEQPHHILTSDFQNFDLIDVDTKEEIHFKLDDLYKNIEHFGFITGYHTKEHTDQAPVNIDASELMGELHDRLKEIGYEGHPLELLLVRILFCLFCDDTMIFSKDAFQFFIEENTKEDGSDLGLYLGQLFSVLDTPVNKRQKTLGKKFQEFPYINGSLFKEKIDMASFDKKMRQLLLQACYFDWSSISPAIFGSLFQSVMDKKKRRTLGAHYTSEENIMKLIEPLFLNDLNNEFEEIKNNKIALMKFHEKLGKLKLLDPACGCGNFLIMAYRELRRLELKVLKCLYGKKQEGLDIKKLLKIDIDNFLGIEIEEFPVRVAEVAMLLMDHKLNLELSVAFEDFYVRIPLDKTPKIFHGNALTMDWEDIIQPNELSYILGNPPFIGKQLRNAEQRQELEEITKEIKGGGVLDYVSAWFIKSAQYVQGSNIKCAFVSTNSISQGEQVGILWNELFKNYKIKIHFAHRTFGWGNESTGKANVHVVIIGFANFDKAKKSIYNYNNLKSKAQKIEVSNINPYLIEGKDLIILSRNTPIREVQRISFGNMPNDGGHLLLSDTEKKVIIDAEPNAKQYIKPFINAYGYLNNSKDWCLWLDNIEPKELKDLKLVAERVKKVKDYRLKSHRSQTRELANTPTLFGYISQPNSNYLIIPRVSSEKRTYIPISFFDKNSIVGDTCLFIINPTLFTFGILTSSMHMGWVRYVCGRMKSDYRYSNKLVYNNFPWPEHPTDKQRKEIEYKAQAILETRKKFPNSSLADLYDPLTMPPSLLKTHQELDKAVDHAYRKQPFKSEGERMEFLFQLYQRYTS